MVQAHDIMKPSEHRVSPSELGFLLSKRHLREGSFVLSRLLELVQRKKQVGSPITILGDKKAGGKARHQPGVLIQPGRRHTPF